jgi:MoaA/NifB/PqqE/SkfB family radical SAM enzyme
MDAKIENLYGLCVEITSHCNYRCVSCPSVDLLRGRGHMADDLFLKIFREIGDTISSVALWNYGEPLMHPNIDQLLPEISDCVCRKKLSTSGYHLEDYADLSFLGSLDELIVSINGLDETTYRRHQVGGDLKKVLRGIERLPEVPDGVQLTLQVVANRYNIGQIPQFRDFGRRYHFDKLVVKSFNVMDYDRKTFRDFVPTARDYSRYDSESMTMVPTDLTRVMCRGGMVIGWDGQAYPCCFDYRGECVLGDVREDGVLGVWHSEEAKAARASVQRGELLGICRTDCSCTRALMEESLHD